MRVFERNQELMSCENVEIKKECLSQGSPKRQGNEEGDVNTKAKWQPSSFNSSHFLGPRRMLTWFPKVLSSYRTQHNTDTLTASALKGDLVMEEDEFDKWNIIMIAAC